MKQKNTKNNVENTKMNLKKNKNIDSIFINQPYPKIALIGFRGVGKSSIAKKIAQIWKTNLISLDEYIEKKNGLTIDKIVANKGWDYFREQEELYLEEFSKSEDDFLLLDLGGGIIEDKNKSKSEKNTKILRDVFFTVYLMMDKDKNIDRLLNIGSTTSRPDNSNRDTLSALYDRRVNLYKSTCHGIVDVTDLSIIEAAQRVIQLFKLKK